MSPAGAIAVNHPGNIRRTESESAGNNSALLRNPPPPQTFASPSSVGKLALEGFTELSTEESTDNIYIMLTSEAAIKAIIESVIQKSQSSPEPGKSATGPSENLS